MATGAATRLVNRFPPFRIAFGDFDICSVAESSQITYDLTGLLGAHRESVYSCARDSATDDFANLLIAEALGYSLQTRAVTAAAIGCPPPQPLSSRFPGHPTSLKRCGLFILKFVLSSRAAKKKAWEANQVTVFSSFYLQDRAD
jgi:hypothetical protein